MLPPADRPLDGRTFCNVIEKAGVEGALLLPNVLEELAEMPEAVPYINRLTYLGWVGGKFRVFCEGVRNATESSQGRSHSQQAICFQRKRELFSSSYLVGKWRSC